MKTPSAAHSLSPDLNPDTSLVNRSGPSQSRQGSQTGVSKFFIIGLSALILSGPLALAADGPSPAGWVPGTDVVETVGSLPGVRRQSGPYHARDVYKVFIPHVAGKILRLTVTAPSGVKVDHYDERRDNGLYAIFGATSAGMITLNYQWKPASSGSWTTAGSVSLTIGPKRILPYDTADIPINIWYTADPTAPGDTAKANASGAVLAAKLERDFANIAAHGFTAVTYIWNPIKDPHIVFNKAAEHGLKVRYPMRNAIAFVDNIPPRRNQVPLLAMEVRVKNDLHRSLGGGELLKNSPALWGYYTLEETQRWAGVELSAMLAKSHDPNHETSAALAGYHSANAAMLTARTPFLQFRTTETYPLLSAPINKAPGDFTNCTPFVFNNDGDTKYSVPDILSWFRSQDPSRRVEDIIQGHKGNVYNAPWGTSYILRHPSAAEMRAQVFMAAARGCGPISYFVYNSFGSITGMLDFSFNESPGLVESTSINAKLTDWMPIYKKLEISPTGSDPINYVLNAPVVGNFVHKETGERYLIVVNTNCTATKTVTVNGIKGKSGGTAATVKDVDTDTVYTLNGGTLQMSLPAGDGALLLVNSSGGGGGGNTTLYSNDMESAGSFGGSLTTSKAHGGSQSEQLPASGSLHMRNVSVDLPVGEISSFVYGVWIHDNNDSSQLYRIGLRFKKPDGTLSPLYETSWKSLGSGWGKITGDFVNRVNTARSEGYTSLHQISLRAYRSSSYKVYYVDDVDVVVTQPGGGGGGSTTLYGNDMESAGSFGGTLTTSKAHGGTQSEQLPGSGSLHTRNVSVDLPVGEISSFVYGIWIHDNDDSSQLYRLGLRFKKPDGTLSPLYETSWKGLGSGWGRITGDFVNRVNTVRSEGYTSLHQITLRAYRSSNYKTYYVDDVELVVTQPGGGGSSPALYTNDMENNSTFGGTLTTSKAHGGTQSEKLPANGVFHIEKISVNLPTGAIDSFLYGVWINDDNDPSQLYRIGLRFQKSNGALSGTYETSWKSIGSGWKKISGDFVNTVNAVRADGYDEVHEITIRAYRPSGFMTYYIDDLSVGD